MQLGAILAAASATEAEAGDYLRFQPPEAIRSIGVSLPSSVSGRLR